MKEMDLVVWAWAFMGGTPHMKRPGPEILYGHGFKPLE